jgi:quercetin dioxygenase-like cupin family protein
VLIDTPTRPLGQVDCRALIQRVMAVDEAAWHADARRQDDYEVHAQTQSIILVFFTGWPAVQVAHAAGWELFSDVAMPIMQQIVARHYPPGGMVLRAVLARLPAGCFIDAHVDRHKSFSVAHRIHVPLITNPRVQFTVGAQDIRPQVGQAFELNNHVPHSVRNDGDAARIHFIFDYSPG